MKHELTLALDALIDAGLDAAHEQGGHNTGGASGLLIEPQKAIAKQLQTLDTLLDAKDAEIAALKADAERLTTVRQAITGYHLALDRREHGGVAMDKAFNKIEQALDMPWQQGKAITQAVQPS